MFCIKIISQTFFTHYLLPMVEIKIVPKNPERKGSTTQRKHGCYMYPKNDIFGDRTGGFAYISRGKQYNTYTQKTHRDVVVDDALAHKPTRKNHITSQKEGELKPHDMTPAVGLISNEIAVGQSMSHEEKRLVGNTPSQ